MRGTIERFGRSQLEEKRFAAFLKQDLAKWAKVVKDAGIKSE
jgi:tripartite-type tricarboxylate transporter receptor subunit TctC